MPAAVLRQAAWYALHMTALYFSVKVCTPWIAGRIHDWILPFLVQGQTEGRLQFLLSHLFAFSFIPAFCAGLISHKYRSAVAAWVWIPPALVLLYHFLTLPTSTLQNHFAAAYHQFFSADFNLPEYRDYREMFAGLSPDILRAAEQLRFTAPFFAGIGYSMASLLSMRYGCSSGRAIPPRSLNY